eukprot:1155534-Pelagomonas_calceolata.AAC.2
MVTMICWDCMEAQASQGPSRSCYALVQKYERPESLSIAQRRSGIDVRRESAPSSILCTFAGTDGGKNKCELCEYVFHGGAMRIRLHFLQVPGFGVAKCKAEDTLVAVDEGKEGEQEGGQQEEGSSSDGEGLFIGEEEDNMGPERLSRPSQQFSTNKFYRALQTATFSVHNFKAIFSVLENSRIETQPWEHLVSVKHSQRGLFEA